MNCAVLDSGCSKTVCGQSWLNCYLETLNSDDLKQVKEEETHSSFKFGDGNGMKSVKKVTIPAKIAGVNIYIVTEVIDGDLPLLLSKDSMKKAETRIDFRTDKVNILGRDMDIKFTSSGHYAIPIHKKNECFIKFG